MDANGDPDGAKKKKKQGGERFWGWFFVSFKKKTVKLGVGGGCYRNTIRHLSTKRITTN